MEVLVSINSVAEAKLALHAGVKWIDLKDTSHGALASLPTQMSTDIIQSMQSVKSTSKQQVTISATVGDAFDNINTFKSQIEEKYDLGIDIIKIPYQAVTLFDNLDELTQAFNHIRKRFSIVVVLTPETLLTLNEGLSASFDRLRAAGAYGVMIDTFDKSRNLFDSLAPTQINFFVETAKVNGFFVGLAGGLQIQHLDFLSKLPLDIVGYRSGISMENDRKLGLNPQVLQLLIKKCGINTN